MIDLAIILLIAVGGPLLIWWGIRSETNDTPVTDRRSAEQAVRADTSTERDAQRETRAEHDPDETRL
ncbi:hypothetical protein halTADL_1611 [Halohasta litchfieldiae]|uniref:Uncharacterized protein n=1 Tax=Halohasta litchfieldiae TaxID=1073996 RepID=A0A1H6UTV4_9EURY|nr:hypothetical protein [Halohasta litchfieldiae]ATW88366.1 hypothetical protein halTADL_1611 [Halohasta litchfieldiae]SEI95843.1 hypothetical protein SAMN05444271_11380 [Halohasta litchfieldiae]